MAELQKIIFSEDEQSIEKLNQILHEKFTIQPIHDKTSGSASDDPYDSDLAIINPRYNEAQLDIIEDVHINDWTANECVLKKTHFVMGKHARLVLDTKKEYRKESDRRTAIEAINNEERFIVAKNDIDKICYDYDLYTFLSDALNSVWAYGRAAIQIIREAISLEPVPSNEGNRSIPGNVSGFKLLNSRRLGRIRVDKKTNRIVGVEYLDIKKIVAGVEVELEDKDKFIPIEDLIYLVNKDGNISTNSQFTGVSRLESIVHISQVKRIIMNKNVKEAALSHYAGVTFAQFPTDTDGSVISQWVGDLAKAAGRVFAHKQNVKVDHHKVETDLDKYSSLVELLDRAIIRAIGIPSFLVGYEQIANYANSEQVLIAWREGELTFWRNWLKDNLQKYLFGPLFQGKIGTDNAVIDVEGSAQEEQEQESESYNNNIQIEPSDVKVTYEFQDISFQPKTEIVNTLKIIKDMGVPLTDEMILRIAGFDEWVEQISQQREVADEKKEQENKDKMENLRLQAENNNNNNNPMQMMNRFPSYNRNQEGASEDMMTNATERIQAQKEKLLKLLEEKIRSLG